MGTTMIEKATRIICDERIEAAGVAALYKVRGDHGTYTVTLGDPYVACTCPATKVCAHITAALYRHEQIGQERAEVYAAKQRHPRKRVSDYREAA